MRQGEAYREEKAIVFKNHSTAEDKLQHIKTIRLFFLKQSLGP